MEQSPRPSLPEIIILGRSGAARYLMSRDPAKGAGVRHAISIGDFDERPAAGFQLVPSRLRLNFSDITQSEAGYVLPGVDDIERLIAFGRRLEGRTVVHCTSGISRSTAAAIICLTALAGADRVAEAVGAVFSACPGARPNAHMIALADAHLGLQGALVSAVSERLSSETLGANRT